MSNGTTDAPPSNGFIHNPYLKDADDDVLYHFGLSKFGHDLSAFSDVKFVCTGGSAGRLQRLAEQFAELLHVDDGCAKRNMCNSDRYAMFKVGPVLCINHGIGVASLSIMLIELIKLLHHAKCKDVICFRVGTSGGLGVAPGTVLISNGVLNGALEPIYVQYIMGKRIDQPAQLDQRLVNELLEVGKSLGIPVETGRTLCADDFYEGQARLDGAFCDYSCDDKMRFIQTLYDKGVRNIEMEATCFASVLSRAGIRGAIVCVTIIDRFEGDQVKAEKHLIHEFEARPMHLVSAYIQQCLRNGQQQQQP